MAALDLKGGGAEGAGEAEDVDLWSRRLDSPDEDWQCCRTEQRRVRNEQRRITVDESTCLVC